MLDKEKDFRALLFPGQGSQVVGMGFDVYQNFSVAREVFEEVDDALGRKLSDIIFQGDAELLNKTENTQPALMAVSMAIIRVMEKKLGARIYNYFSYAAGHSLGEYTALCAADVASIYDVARVLGVRGLAMQDAVPLGEGGMIALLNCSSIEDAMNIVSSVKDKGLCQIANDNGAGQIVLSGEISAINEAREVAKSMKIKALPLKVSGPFHSDLMHDAAATVAEALDNIAFDAPKMKVVQNVSVKYEYDVISIKKNLVQQICDRVRWAETINYFKNHNVKEYVEIGSGKVLGKLCDRICGKGFSISINSMESIDLLCEKIEQFTCEYA